VTFQDKPDGTKVQPSKPLQRISHHNTLSRVQGILPFSLVTLENDEQYGESACTFSTQNSAHF
jgi:hypothetical protein